MYLNMAWHLAILGHEQLLYFDMYMALEYIPRLTYRALVPCKSSELLNFDAL